MSWFKSQVARRVFAPVAVTNRVRASEREIEQGRGRSRRKKRHLLGTLLLCEHFLLLLHNFCLVFEGESEGKANEEGRGGDYPDDVSDDLARFF